jgi:phage-related protein
MASSALATAFVNIVPGTQELESYLKTGLPAQGAKGGEGLGEGVKKGFGSKIKGLLGPLAAGFSIMGIGRFVGDMYQGAIEAQKVDAVLGKVAESMGIFGSETTVVTDRLKDFATAQMGITGTDDEIIKGAQAKLLTFKNLAASAGEAGGMFDRATVVAQDMAAVFGGSASDKAVLLGKALNDPVKGLASLSRVGVQFTTDQKDMIKGMVEAGDVAGAQALIMKELETQVGGTAAASATAGEKMKVKWDDLVETVGQKLMPIFNTVADYITNSVIPALENFGAWIQDNSKWLGPLAITVASFVAAWAAFSFVSGLIGLIQGLAVVMGILQIATVGSAAAKWAENMAWLASPITWIILGIMAVVAAIVLIATQTTWFQDMWKVMVDAVSAAWEWLWGMLKPVFDFIGAAFKILWDYWINPIITLWLIAFAVLAKVFEWLYNTAIKPVFELIGAVFNWLWKNIIDPVIKWVVGAFEAVGKTVSNVFGGIGKFIKDTFDGIVSIIRGPVNAIIDLINGMIDGLNKIQIKVPDWVPLIGGQTIGFNIPKIPRLAKGGFVNSPTTALIGEAGPEVVTPLKDFERMMGLDGNGGSGKTINYYAAPNQSLDSEQALFMAMKRAKTVASW